MWCSGCGIGIVVNTFLQTLRKIPFAQERIQLITSGLGCTGKISNYVKLKTIQSGENDPFLTALNCGSPDGKTVIFIHDSDILAHGLDGLVKACHSGGNIMAVYINGFILHILGLQKQCLPLKHPNRYNFPVLVHRSGAGVIARWTPLHCRRLMASLRTGLLMPGFSFIEVVSPCLMYDAETKCVSKKLNRMARYLKNARINHDAEWNELELRDLNHFYIGHFSGKK